MSQSIHNDGNWQRVDTGEWVPKAEHDNLRFALTDALVREDALREANTKLHHELIDCTHDRAALRAQVERLSAPVEFSYDEINELCFEFGAPEYRLTDDGEARYWSFSDSELPVADTLAELFHAARGLIAARASQKEQK